MDADYFGEYFTRINRLGSVGSIGITNLAELQTPDLHPRPQRLALAA
jgi:hypothetical protein